MRRFIFLLMFFCSFFKSNSYLSGADQPDKSGEMVTETGWIDDSHYLIIRSDRNNVTTYNAVDAKSGVETKILPVKSRLEVLKDALPTGLILSNEDVVSNDFRMVIMKRENDIYLFSIGSNNIERLTNDPATEVNVKFSSDNRKIAYTKNKDLYVLDLNSKKETRLTFDASETVYNGYSSWVYMEEILGRSGKYSAFWWSPDGNSIAYLRTDETNVPVYTVNRLDEPDGIHGKKEPVPYPNPGDPNPKVRLGIVNIASTVTAWIKTDINVDQYIAWPFWMPDGKKIAVQLVNRDQNNLKIILADVPSGDYSTIYNEKRDTWVEFFEDTYVMKNGSGFIIRSYKNGWRNLYYYDWKGNLISQITNFNFEVTGIEKVDEDAEMVYVSATGPESTDQQYYRISFDGKKILRLTSGSGTHKIEISPVGSYFIDTWNSILSSGSIVLIDKNARVVREIFRYNQDEYNTKTDSRTELVRITTSDSLFSMPATITYPVNFDPSKKYPVVFTIYGGPGYKNVSNKWFGYDPSWYSQHGIITFSVDHRGSGHFGMKGEDYLYRNLGKWEILDYEDAVKWLREKPYVDDKRIGITGSSYGGYMTCLALTKGADFWTHGIGGSPVTDWRLYDNVYTERYMDTPEDNPDGYRESSVLTYVGKYKGSLYLTHGDIDDNVHLQNSIYLISRLENEGKSFRFMLYPDERHGFTGLKAMHSRNESYRFWLKSFFDE
jgi:dipeptidyl-peptidase 4